MKLLKTEFINGVICLHLIEQIQEKDKIKEKAHIVEVSAETFFNMIASAFTPADKPEARRAFGRGE